MRMFLVFLGLGACFSAVSPSPASLANVHFSSVNLRNVLHWLPGNSTAEDAYYTVQYAIYGDSVESIRGRRVNWKTVRHCTEILQNWCDLSNETWDLDQWYHARVRVKTRESTSKWATTWKRFDPQLDTIFGPPSLTVELQNNTAIITLKGPMRYQPNNDTPLIPMATLYPRMRYDLSINKTHQNRSDVFLAVSSPHKYQQMEHNTKFCFSAKASFSILPVVCQQSVWHCITTPPDPEMELMKMVVVGFIVATISLCILIVVGFFLIQYLMGKGQKSPLILEETESYQSPLTFPSDKPNIILITLIKDKLTSDLISCTYHAQSNLVTAAPDPEQRNIPWREDCSLEYDDDALSVDYGTVAAVSMAGPEVVRGFGDSEKTNPQSLQGNGRIDSVVSNDQQMMSYFPQRSEIHSPIYTRKNTLVQAQRFNPEVVNGSEAWWERGGVVSLTHQMEAFAGSVKEKTGGKINMKESEEIEPFLCSYAFQSCHSRPSFQSNQSECSNDYGFVMSLSREMVNEEDGSIIDWDPETRKLTLPKLEKVLLFGEGFKKPKMANQTSSAKMLDNVLVRQNSGEKEAQEELDEDIMLTKWNVIISMDG